MDWNDIRVGDTVKVRHNRGATIEGEVGLLGSGTVRISNLAFFMDTLEIIGHTPGYKDGDIGVLFHSDGNYFVGVYDSKRKKFYANNTAWNTTAQFGTEYENIKIVGNVKELA